MAVAAVAGTDLLCGLEGLNPAHPLQKLRLEVPAARLRGGEVGRLRLEKPLHPAALGLKPSDKPQANTGVWEGKGRRVEWWVGGCCCVHLREVELLLTLLELLQRLVSGGWWRVVRGVVRGWCERVEEGKGKGVV